MEAADHQGVGQPRVAEAVRHLGGDAVLLAQQHAPQQARRRAGQVRLQGAAHVPPQGQDQPLPPPVGGQGLDALQLIPPVGRGRGVHALQLQEPAEVEGAGVARRLGPPEAGAQPDAVAGAGRQPEAAQGHPHAAGEGAGPALVGMPALGLEDEPHADLAVDLALLRLARQPAHEDPALAEALAGGHVVRRPQARVLVVTKPSGAGGQDQQADRGEAGARAVRYPARAADPATAAATSHTESAGASWSAVRIPAPRAAAAHRAGRLLAGGAGTGRRTAIAVPDRLDPVHPPGYIGGPCPSA